MEAVELVVYIGIAIVIGGLILGFLAGWNAQDTYEGIKDLFHGPETTAYEEIGSDQLARVALDVWQECGLGSTNLSKTVHVTDTVLLNKTSIFTAIKAANVCRTLQSVNQNCGSREDVVFTPVQGPVILTLKCDPASERLLILA